MSQLAIVIDVPDYGADVLAGQISLTIAENVAKEVRKQLPIDDGVRVRQIALGNDLVVNDESYVPPAEESFDVEPEPPKPEPIKVETPPKPAAKKKAPAKRKPAAKKAPAKKPAAPKAE